MASLPSWALRHEFDSERIPELSGPAFLQDIHSVSSLCKLYFRELPNPLLTYQLYGKFSVSLKGAMQGDSGLKPQPQPAHTLLLHPVPPGGHVCAWGGGATGPGSRCHPAAAPTSLPVWGG